MRKLRAWQAWKGLPLPLRVSLAWRGLLPMGGATPPALLPNIGEGNLIRREQYRLSAPWERNRAVFSSTLSQEGALQEGLLLGTLLGQDRFYGAPGESSSEKFDYQTAPLWAARTRKRKPNEGHIDTDVPLQLLGQDRFYGGPGQAITWGVTEKYRSLPRERLLQYYTHPMDVQFPIEQPAQTWYSPNPLPYLRLHQHHSWTTTGLIGQDTFYGEGGQGYLSRDEPKWVKWEPLSKHQDHVVQGLVNGTLSGQDTFYGDPGQSLPASAEPKYRKLGIERLLQGWSRSELLYTLLGQDTFYGDVGQAIAFDWTQLGTPKLPIRIPQSDYALQDAQGTVLGSRDPFIPIDQSLTGQRTYAVFAEMGLGSSRNRILLVGRRSRLLLLR